MGMVGRALICGLRPAPPPVSLSSSSQLDGRKMTLSVELALLLPDLLLELFDTFDSLAVLTLLSLVWMPPLTSFSGVPSVTRRGVGRANADIT